MPSEALKTYKNAPISLCGSFLLATMPDSVASQVRFHVRPARSESDLKSALQLFTSYAKSLDIDPAPQDFETEKSALPGKYAPPLGEILLAWSTAKEPVGCIALRPTAIARCCEIKRHYILPEFRGMGLGRCLIDAAVQDAKLKEYTLLRLDTLPTMTQAISLYENAGFDEMDDYYHSPSANAVFMELELVFR